MICIQIEHLTVTIFPLYGVYLRMRSPAARSLIMLQSDYESFEDGALSSSSVCARLASSSPPESFANSYRLPLAARASSRSPRPAVLIVSDEIPVQDVQSPAPIAIKTPLSVHSASPRDYRKPDGSNNIHHVPQLVISRRRRRAVTLFLAVCLLVFGGLVIPVSWVALLDQDSGAGAVHPTQHAGQRHVQCHNIRTRLQFVLIGQGLVLSLTGVFLAGCWSGEPNLDQGCNHKEPRKLLKQLSSISTLVTVVLVLSFTAVLAGLAFYVWELMSSTIYCSWSPSEYAVLSSLELAATLMSAVSTGVVSMLTFCRE